MSPESGTTDKEIVTARIVVDGNAVRYIFDQTVNMYNDDSIKLESEDWTTMTATFSIIRSKTPAKP